MAFKSVFSDDIFISYSRADGSTYAVGLADALTKKGFSCFSDRLGTVANKGLSPELIAKIRSCAMMVLIGTDGAGKSEFVGQEIAHFSQARGTARIVPIDFAGAIYKGEWYPLIEGIAPEPESPRSLETGDPSLSVVSRIEKSFSYTRSKERLRRYTVGAAATLIVLIAASAAAGIYAARQLRMAEQSRTIAEQEKRRAERATRLADEKTKLADEKTKLADEATRREQQANEARTTAEEKTLTAQRQQEIAEGKTRAAEQLARRAGEEAKRQGAEAKKQGEIARSRQLANESTLKLRQEPDSLRESVRLAVESVNLATAIRVPSLEADVALRESLALLARSGGSQPYPASMGNLTFSPDAKYFVALSGNDTAQIFPAANPQGHHPSVQTVTGLVAGAQYVALSNEAKRLASTDGQEIRVKDLASQESWDMRVEYSSIDKMALSPDGKYLALVVEPDSAEDRIKTAELWDVEKKKRIANLNAVMRINSVAFSANGKMLAVAGSLPTGRGETGYGVLWNLEAINFDKGQLDDDPSVEKARGPGEKADDTGTGDEDRGENASPDDERAVEAVSSEFDRVKVLITQDREIMSLAPGPDEEHFASASGATVTTWRARTHGVFEPVARIPLETAVENLVFSPDGARLSVTRKGATVPQEKCSPLELGDRCEDTIYETWDAAGYSAATVVPYDSMIESVGFRPGGGVVLAFTGRSDLGGDLKAWRVPDGREQEEAETNFDGKEVKDVEPGFRYAVTGRDEQVNVQHLLERRTYPVPTTSVTRISQTKISRNGRVVALAGVSPQDRSQNVVAVYAFDENDYSLKHVLNVPSAVAGLSMTDDGRLLAFSLSGTPGLRIVDTASGDDVTPPGLERLENFDSMQLSPTGKFVAAFVGSDQSYALSVWSADHGELAAHTEHGCKINAFAFSPDERFVATAGEDGEAHVLTLDGKLAGRERESRLKYTRPVSQVVFSPRSDLLATVGGDGTVRLFETASLTEISRLRNDESVTALAFSEKEDYLAIACKPIDPDFDINEHPYALRVWSLESGELIREARSRISMLPERQESSAGCNLR